MFSRTLIFVSTLLVGLILISSCSTHQTQIPAPQINEELVSLSTALIFGKMSYLTGCMQMAKKLKQKKIHDHCVQKSKIYIEEMKSIINQTGLPKDSTPP